MRGIFASLQADGFRIFLASPSGLDEYRRAARDQFEQIRMNIAKPRGIDLDPIGWEDLPPGFGRPQSLINPKLDECNVLIGILGKRLGTPTGVAESGFVEEYERMATRARAGEDVAIWIYMLQLASEDLEDPGEKLKAVLEFRERLYQEALVKEIRNVDDFRAQLYRDLASLVLEADERKRQSSESLATPEADEGRPAPDQEPSDEAHRQLHDLLAQAAEEVPGLPDRFRDERFPLARLGLWLSTWEGWYFTNETFGIHQLNRVYAMREQVALSPLERRHVLRTMCAQRRTAPGWALLGYDDARVAAELLVLAADDTDDAVRAGAFEMLERGPIDRWLARDDVDLDRQRILARFREQVNELNDSVRAALIDFLARIGGEEARDFLAELAERDPTKRQALPALIRLHAAEGSRHALALAADADIALDARTLSAIRDAAVGAELDELARLAAVSDERLRIVATKLLAERGQEASPALVAKLDDPADDVALSAFIAICDVDDPQTDLRRAFAKLRERESLKFNDQLLKAFDGTLDVQTLREEIDWLEPWTANAYAVLADEHWDEFHATVRHDLGDRFEEFAEASRAKLRKKFPLDIIEALETGGTELVTVGDGVLKRVDPEVVEQFRSFLAGSTWNDRRFAAAALAGIASNGEAEDARLVRPWLDSEYHEVREAAAVALARVGSDDDVGTLLEASQLHGGEAFARAAISLSPGSSGAARDLVDSTRASDALIGARHLHTHASDLPQEAVETLLHHANEDVRQVCVACALIGADTSALENLLDRYTSTGHYYYNVVFWLDRALFGPPYLRDRTRETLAAFAAEERPPELPSVLDRSLRHWAAEYIRGRAST